MPLDPHGVGPADASSRSHWRAALALRFARVHDATRLVHREHVGPLVVQRALHPEGPDVVQVVIVHPPGGIAGGDALRLAVHAEEHAQVQLVTPSASKWYRSRGQPARQDFTAEIANAGVLEWLPHEAIVFDAAHARMTTRLVLHGSALAMAWDVTTLGRTASGERFLTGSVRQRFEVVRDGAPMWIEQAAFGAGDALLASPVGLAALPAFGTFVIAAPGIEDAWLAAARSVGSELANHDAGVTRLPGVLIARARSARAGSIHTWFSALWQALRPLVVGRPAVVPRLWST